MIFAVSNHVELIKKGLKTETRRSSDRYEVGKSYAVQPCRTCKAILEGRILITQKRKEKYRLDSPISKSDAKAEGDYTPEEFEELYEKLHSYWLIRYAYTFRFIPKETE